MTIHNIIMYRYFYKYFKQLCNQRFFFDKFSTKKVSDLFIMLQCASTLIFILCIRLAHIIQQ